MLHSKPRGHWPFGSGEEDFEKVLPYMGMTAILVMLPRCGKQTYVPLPTEAPYEIWLWLARWFLRRRRLKRVDDGRTKESAYTITSLMSPKGSGELKYHTFQSYGTEQVVSVRKV